MITLTLPMPPTLNHMWGMSGKRKYLKKEAHQFREAVVEEAIRTKAKISGRLAIFIALYPSSRRKFDIDNRIKAVQDALQLAGVFLDDEQIDFLWVVRRPIVQGGMCKVVLVEHEKVHQMLEDYEEYI